MPDERPTARWRRLGLRLVLPVLFPVVAAAASAAAAVAHGTARLLWIVLSVSGTAATAVVAVRRDRQTAAAESAAAAAEAHLATGLNEAGAPLLAALGNLTTAPTQAARTAALDVLVHRAVDIAHHHCGRRRRTPHAARRAVFYALQGDDRLERRAYAGRQSNAPRRGFRLGATAHDTEAVRLALSEEVLVVDDLHAAPPPHFADAKGRSYRSFIAVPVRAGDTPFGLLVLDTDQPGALTNADKGHLILLAGVLAAGLSHAAAQAKQAAPRARPTNGRRAGVPT
ncbi:GAF domain-containing protein [Dactylosporangium roseum]|uniref:GAF domain-containing protein n=1 Tax=Dactylosporangium roseum TaxID=47989 RepID=A0ABY5ZCS9_9ACTN|nr:GAF domain-containing protein [Dactylosporangium roseum]UWZ39940.1 GAF domain-containing protein [Dactylosporangium roseum]